MRHVCRRGDLQLVLDLGLRLARLGLGYQPDRRPLLQHRGKTLAKRHADHAVEGGRFVLCEDLVCVDVPQRHRQLRVNRFAVQVAGGDLYHFAAARLQLRWRHHIKMQRRFGPQFVIELLRFGLEARLEGGKLDLGVVQAVTMIRDGVFERSAANTVKMPERARRQQYRGGRGTRQPAAITRCATSSDRQRRKRQDRGNRVERRRGLRGAMKDRHRLGTNRQRGPTEQ
jgi:hypothetical protein